MTTVLNLGSGRMGRDIEVNLPGPIEMVTLDADSFHNPDYVRVLGKEAIPLPDNSVDYAIAIHVLEHIGKIGDAEEWFFFWEDLYRVLKPDAKLQFESPLFNSTWTWADPTHVRALSPESFIYLAQVSYTVPGSSISCYRIHCDFEPLFFEGVPDKNPQVTSKEPISHFRGILQAKKPLKRWWDV